MFRRTWSALLCWAACAAAYAFDAEGWRWERPIEGAVDSGFVSLTLPRDVLAQSQPSLHDLRVVTGDSLVPHIISWDGTPQQKTMQDRPLSIINRTYEPRQFARAVLDFGSGVPKNRVRVQLSGDNYRRKVLIEGSADAATWELVADNLWLVAVNLQERQFRSDELEFPPNNFRYLRLTVYNMPDDPDRIEFVGASAEGETPAVAGVAAEKHTLKPISVGTDPKDKHTSWVFDLQTRHAPITRLKFNISDPFFYRAFEVYGRNTTTHLVQTQSETGMNTREVETPWTHLRSGVLFRILEETTTTTNLSLDGLGPAPRFLSLRVYNADNPPLALQDAVASIRLPRLVFSSAAGAPYKLFYGNDAAPAPVYDLGTAVRNLNLPQLPEVTLGKPQARKAAAKPAPWSERNAPLLLGGIVVLAAAFAWFLFGSIRKLPPPAEGPN